jgi:hypothetical protein
MTKEFYLKQIFQIIELPEGSQEIISSREFMVNNDGLDILIVVTEDLKQIEAKTKFQITDKLHHIIHSHLIIHEPFVEGRQEQINEGIAKAQQSLIQAINKLVDLMAFTIGYIFLIENLRQGNCYCSLDSEHWEDVNKRQFTVYSTFSWNTIPGLNEREEKTLQIHIDKKIEPFLATHHLFKAIKETDSRHQLMNLALALELGIKEYLVRKKSEPEIEVLIKKLPSPPLVKLYGEILECFAGEKTPVTISIIEKLTKDRNNLIHTVIRQDKQNLNSHDIKNYRAATEIAIYHLWLDLYPYDEIITLRYKSLLERNEPLLRKGYYKIFMSKFKNNEFT